MEIATFMIFMIAALLPNASLTPGAIATTDRAAVCSPSYARTHRHVSSHLKAEAFRRYGIPTDERRRYVIDHLVPLELGGANTIANIWPQPKNEAKRKDRVEALLHERVCSGAMSLPAAQNAIRTNWQKP
jgi:hypothetical protein